MPCVRPLPEEYNSPKACNDADACPTLRTGVRGMYLTAPLDAQARSKVHTGLLSRLSPHHGDGANTVATKGTMGLAMRGTSTQKGELACQEEHHGSSLTPIDGNAAEPLQ